MEDLNIEVEEDGLTRQRIQEKTEQKLLKAGMRVLSVKEWREEKGEPWLYVYAHILKKRFLKAEVYLFNISVELKQKVYLARDTDMEVFATTWSRAVLGKSGDINDIEKGINDELDNFISVCLIENPK